jgi:hypothetical protein
VALGVLTGQHGRCALVDDWINAQGGRFEKADAGRFLSWIAYGGCTKDSFAATHKELFEKVLKWRKAFLQSIVVAHAAAELNPKLTAPALKAIAQQIVNGAPTKPFSKATAQAAIAGVKQID